MKFSGGVERKCFGHRKEHMQRTVDLSALRKHKDLVCGWSSEFVVGSVKRLG